ncbi:MAG: hypothetical protein PHU77_03650 [Simplicispira sp.]|nr:hypothetical protein [Simplicispira sp.]
MSTTPEFQSFASPALSESQRVRLREQICKTFERTVTDGSLPHWSDVYIPENHLQALDPRRMVVEGMRGAGKSFWTGVLTQPQLREALQKQSIGFDLKEALAGITESHAIAIDGGAGTASGRFPNHSELPKLLQLQGVTAETIWRVATLRLFPVDPELGMPQSNDPYDPWSEPIAWAGQHPERIVRAIEMLDQRWAVTGKSALVVFDALDRVSHELTEVERMAAGLLRFMLDLRFAKGLRIKAFFREDVLARTGPSVVDGSKLLNQRAKLHWQQADLYGLAFYRLAQNAPHFRTQFNQRTGFTWTADSGQRYQCDKASDPQVQKMVWQTLVGNYMGKTATKGHTYPYIFKHLSDGWGRVAPRAFLIALGEAAQSAAKSYAEKPYVIYHEAIKDGVREASQARVKELEEDYAWIAPALQCIKRQQKTVPIDRAVLEDIWLQDGAEVLHQIEALRDKALIPWRKDASNHEKVEALYNTLVEIGVLQSRLKNSNERVELPDIYRLAYKIGRYGGISTNKRP